MSVGLRQEQGLSFGSVGDKRLPPASIAPALHCRDGLCVTIWGWWVCGTVGNDLCVIPRNATQGVPYNVAKIAPSSNSRTSNEIPFGLSLDASHRYSLYKVLLEEGENYECRTCHNNRHCHTHCLCRKLTVVYNYCSQLGIL